MDHTATMRRFFDCVNSGDLEGFIGLMADDFVEHEVIEGFPPTRDGVRQFFSMYLAAFPDLRMEAEDVFASGDKVVARVRCTGTHQGELMGMPPTGKSVDIQAIDIVRFGDDGKAKEHWGITDELGMMRQLGAVPEGAPA